MKFWLSFRLFVMALTLCLAVECWCQEADVQEAEDADEEEVQLPESPLKLLEMDYVNAGEMTDFLVRELTFSVENKGKEAVLFKRVMSSCRCLTIEEAPLPGRVEPGAKLVFKVKLNGAEIGHAFKDFERRVYLECANYSRLTVPVRGTFKEVLDIKPSSVLDLGVFEGYNVPWSRTVTISMTDVKLAENFELQPPAESRNFTLKLTKKGNNAYDLEVRPKLPMRPGELSEEVFLAMPKIDKTKGVKLKIKGYVQGISLLMPDERLVVHRSLDKVETQEVIVKIGKEDSYMNQREQHFRSSRLMTRRMRQREQEAMANMSNIAKEEEAHRDEYGKKVWEDFDKDFAIQCPEGITARREVSSEGIKIVLMLNASAWGEGEVTKEVVYLRKGKKLTSTQLRLCQPRTENKGVKPPVTVH